MGRLAVLCAVHLSPQPLAGCLLQPLVVPPLPLGRPPLVLALGVHSPRPLLVLLPS